MKRSSFRIGETTQRACEAAAQQTAGFGIFILGSLCLVAWLTVGAVLWKPSDQRERRSHSPLR